MIAFTSTKNTSMVNKTREISADKHIVKPFSHQNLKIILSGSPVPARPPKTVFDFSVKLQVLMVEDNPVNQKLQKKILEKMGHTVDIAKDGKIAVEYGVNPKYDIIFMDMQLPEMSGVEATIELRKLGVKIPIIALTANAFESDKTKCIEAGMDDFLSKPVNLKAFQKTLKKFSDMLTAGST